MSTRRGNHAEPETRHIGWFVAIPARAELPSLALIRFISRLLILAVLLAGVVSGGLIFG